MSIFLNENSKVIVQGMTGSEGRKHTQRMLASGTAIVGGVNPSKAGQDVDFDGATVPVFGSGFVHVSATKALAMLGVGRRQVRMFPADESGRLDVAALLVP